MNFFTPDICEKHLVHNDKVLVKHRREGKLVYYVSTTVLDKNRQM